MKKNIFLIITLLTIITNSIAQITEKREVSSFKELKISNSVNVIYSQNLNQKIEVSWEKENLPFLKTEIVDNALFIYIENKDYKDKLDTKNLLVTISNPNLNTITVTSSANIKISDTLNTDKLTINTTSNGLFTGKVTCENATVNATSNSEVNLNIRTKTIEISATSSSEIKLKGSTTFIQIETTSSAKCNAKNFSAKTAKIIATSSSNVDVSVLESIDAKATSSANINYYGKINIVKKEETSSGKVKNIL